VAMALDEYDSTGGNIYLNTSKKLSCSKLEQNLNAFS
jgi:hypothetical protein